MTSSHNYDVMSNGSHRDDVSQSTMAARSSKTYAEGNTTLRGGSGAGEMNVTMTTLNGSDRGRINAQLPAKMVSLLSLPAQPAEIIIFAPVMFIDSGRVEGERKVVPVVSCLQIQEVLLPATRATPEPRACQGQLQVAYRRGARAIQGLEG